MAVECEIEGVPGELAEFLAGEAEVGVSELVLVEEGGVEHGGIVGIEGDGDAGVEKAADGVIFEAVDDAGADVGGDGDVEGDLVVAEVLDEEGVVDGADAVADAGGAALEGGPDGFGAVGFTGVGKDVEAGVAGEGEDVVKDFGGTAGLVATDAEADDTTVAAFGGEAGNL